VEAAFITVSGLNLLVLPLAYIVVVRYVLGVGLEHFLALTLNTKSLKTLCCSVTVRV